MVGGSLLSTRVFADLLWDSGDHGYLWGQTLLSPELDQDLTLLTILIKGPCFVPQHPDLEMSPIPLLAQKATHGGQTLLRSEIHTLESP